MSNLVGRRIHIAGSVPKNANRDEMAKAREFIQTLVVALMSQGASFVIPIDEEKVHVDQTPITFDWLVFETVTNNLLKRNSQWSNGSLIVAVNHNKSRDSIPERFAETYDEWRAKGYIKGESAHHWNMNSKRMDVQALHGDILITIGGDEGVLYLANLYHETGRPVIPLDFAICPPDKGSRKLFALGKTREHAGRFFQLQSTGGEAHDMFDRLDFPARFSSAQCTQTVMDLLSNLERPIAFAVRLLNPEDTENYKDVEDHFAGVVKPFVEDELGYRLIVIDANHAHSEPFINQEIFNNLHRAQLVVADLSGLRSNCFTELGYALGRQRRTLVMAKKGTKLPFDTAPVDTDIWSPEISIPERRKNLAQYWSRVQNRRSIVEANPLVS
jgi:hypothetical protein